MQRKLNLASLAPAATLQADSRLTCFLAGTNASGAVQLTLGADANEARSLIARLGDQRAGAGCDDGAGF